MNLVFRRVYSPFDALAVALDQPTPDRSDEETRLRQYLAEHLAMGERVRQVRASTPFFDRESVLKAMQTPHPKHIEEDLIARCVKLTEQAESNGGWGQQRDYGDETREDLPPMTEPAPEAAQAVAFGAIYTWQPLNSDVRGFWILDPGQGIEAPRFLTNEEMNGAITGHASDCATNSEPAYPAGPCDCGAEDAVDAEWRNRSLGNMPDQVPPFEKGDVVRLVSGGPDLTVADCFRCDQCGEWHVDVCWHDYNGIFHEVDGLDACLLTGAV
jgi:uncharacterized protein YodC (DUF2158 family)